MRKLGFAFVFFQFLSFQVVSAQDFEWANTHGASAFDGASTIKVDGSGNTYVSGWFRNTVDFDPGPDVLNYTAPGGYSDLFVQKLDADGNLIWIKVISGFQNETGGPLHVDAEGNVYVGGITYSTTLDLDPGVGTDTYSLVGERDMFVVKLDADGNFIWGIGFGGGGNETIHQITTDLTGNVWVTGSFEETVDFDPGAGTFNLTASAFRDGFIMRLDSDAGFLSAHSIGGGVSNDEGLSLLADEHGNVYATGRFSGTVDFDPGLGVSTLVSEGTSDAYIQKMNGDGELIWAKSLVGNNITWALSMAFDQSGNLYINGRTTSDSVDFDMGAETHYLQGDRYLLKTDTAGAFIWAKTLTCGSSTSSSNALAVDADDRVFTVGNFTGATDFDPSADTDELTALDSDFYIWTLDTDGNYEGVTTIGGPEGEQSTSIAINGENAIYVTGIFENTVDFDPGPDDASETSAGNTDAFILKLNQCTPTTGVDVQTACESFTWIDGITYTESTDEPTFTLVNEAGCDSVVTLNLTINLVTEGVAVEAHCESYTWIDGVTYTESTDEPTFTLVNEAGCDSIVTLNLTIYETSSGVDVQNHCGPYTWIDGTTYSESTDEPTFTLTNAFGCDSIVTLNLTIGTVNTTVLIEELSLVAEEEDASYQWMTCPEMEAIAGATAQTFTPAENGDYAVIITKDGCTDTSDCVTFSSIGLPDFHQNNTTLRVYPNPSGGMFSLDLGKHYAQTQVDLYSVQGKQLQSLTFSNTERLDFNLDYPAGIYHLIVIREGTTSHVKVQLVE